LVGRDSRSAITQFAASTTDAVGGDGQRRTDVTQDQGDVLLGQPSRTLSALGHPHCQKNPRI
jgi:hypothetical protein